MPSDPEPIPSRTAAAIAGIAAGAAALGVAELLAGLLPGAASPIIAVGDLVIALQPPGAKQFVVDLVGEADKLVLNLFIAAVAVAITAGIGVLARTRPGTARILIALGGVLALAAGLRDPLAEPITTLIVAGVAVGVAIWVLGWLMRLAAEACVAAGGRDAGLAAPALPRDLDRRGRRGGGERLRRPDTARSRPPERRGRRGDRFRRRSRRRRRCPPGHPWTCRS